MKLSIMLLFAFFLTSCSAWVYGKEMQTQDCATRHLKVLAKSNNMTPEFYEKIVEECREIYEGRP